MKKTWLALVAATLISAPVFAGGTPQNHKCMKDGAEQKLTKKECKKAGGTWEKMAAAPTEAEPKKDEPKKEEPKKEEPKKEEPKKAEPAKK